MSNYSSLKATINANVKQNGNQEITGVIMNSVLNAMVDSLGAGYQYKGVATPATNPGTPDYNVFYLASEAGTYTNFGGLVIGDNEVAALVYNGSWSKQTTGAATASEVSQLAQEVTGNEFALFNEGKLSAKIVPNSYVNENTGVFTPYNNWSRTDYINVRPFTQIKINAAHASNYGATYDANKNRIGRLRIENGSTILTVSGDIHYIAVSDTNSYIPSISFEILGYKADAVSNVLKFDGKLKIGNAWIYQGALNYNDTDTTKVSTARNLYLSLHNGDVVALSSYASYRLYVMRDNGGTWEYVTGNAGLSDCTITNDGNYVICVDSRSGDASLSDVIDLLSIKTQSIATFVDFKSLGSDSPGTPDESDSTKLSPIVLSIPGANTVAKKLTLRTIKGHTYRLYFPTAAWPWSNTGSGSFMYLDDADGNSVFSYSKTYYPDGFKYRDFVAKTDAYTLAIRANSGTTVEIIFADITDLFDTSVVAYNGGYSSVRERFTTLLRKSKGTSPSRVNFVFYSDIHNGAENNRRIAEFHKTFSGFISDVIHGGDSVYDKFTDENTVAEYGGQSFLNTIGNHDVLKEGGEIATGLEAYNKFIAPNVAQWGDVVFPEDAAANGYCYYHKDYTDAKVRLIVVDCMHWDSTQKDWFVATLADAKTNGLSVICVSHYCPDRFPTMISDCTFCTLYTSDVNAGLNSEAEDAVADAITDGLDFICWLFGHTHSDYFVKSHNHPEQYAIGVDKGYGGLASYDCSREDGTRFYDSFDVIGIDTKAGILSIMKMGANADMYMRQKNYLVFDYKNRQIISNS